MLPESMMRAIPKTIIAAIVAVSAPSSASVVLALDLRELTRQASVIAHVEVTATEGRRLPSGQIITDVEALVLEGIKGASDGETIQLITEGGVAEGVGAVVPGEPRLVARQRWILFLEPVEQGLRIMGMSQGALRIVPSDRGPLVLPGGDGLVLVRRSPTGTRPATAALRAPRALSSVLGEVRDLVR